MIEDVHDRDISKLWHFIPLCPTLFLADLQINDEVAWLSFQILKDTICGELLALGSTAASKPQQADELGNGDIGWEDVYWGVAVVAERWSGLVGLWEKGA